MARILSFTLSMLFLSLQQGFVSTALACDTSKMLSQLLGVRPEQVKWKVDLSSQCSISFQGGLGSCWANSGAEYYNQFFHRHGMLPTDKKLNLDYYAGRLIHDRAIQGYKTHNITRDTSYNLEELHDFIFSKGLVYEEQYHFPVIEGKNIRHPKLLEKMWDELTQAESVGASPKLYSKVLHKYLGDLNSILTEKLSPEMAKQIRPHGLSGYQATPEKIELIEKKVIESLENNTPVQFGMNQYGNQIHTAKDSAHLFSKKEGGSALRESGGHAMNIVGYTLKPNGKVDLYLIENSFGENYGSKGFLTLRASYLYERADSFMIPPMLAK